MRSRPWRRPRSSDQPQSKASLDTWKMSLPYFNMLLSLQFCISYCHCCCCCFFTHFVPECKIKLCWSFHSHFDRFVKYLCHVWNSFCVAWKLGCDSVYEAYKACSIRTWQLHEAFMRNDVWCRCFHVAFMCCFSVRHSAPQLTSVWCATLTLCFVL